MEAGGAVEPEQRCLGDELEPFHTERTLVHERLVPENASSSSFSSRLIWKRLSLSDAASAHLERVAREPSTPTRLRASRPKPKRGAFTTASVGESAQFFPPNISTARIDTANKTPSWRRVDDDRVDGKDRTVRHVPRHGLVRERLAASAADEPDDLSCASIHVKLLTHIIIVTRATPRWLDAPSRTID